MTLRHCHFLYSNGTEQYPGLVLPHRRWGNPFHSTHISLLTVYRQSNIGRILHKVIIFLAALFINFTAVCNWNRLFIWTPRYIEANGFLSSLISSSLHSSYNLHNHVLQHCNNYILIKGDGGILKKTYVSMYSSYKKKKLGLYV